MRSRSDAETRPVCPDFCALLGGVAKRRSRAVGRADLQLTDLPDRLFGAPRVQPLSQKYSCSLLTQITSISAAIPSHTEGRIAIVTDVGSGMRWTRQRLGARLRVSCERSRAC